MYKKYFIVSLMSVGISCITMAHDPAILVTGGAGYIGSATTHYLLEKGYNVIVLDKKLPESTYFAHSLKVSDPSGIPDLSFPDIADKASHVIFIQSDFADESVLASLFSTFSVDAVIHFAGFIEVGRSVKDPEAYYDNNVQKTMTLLKMMRQFHVQKMIFSSSAAVYGSPKTNTLVETHEKNPISPYGKTKYMIDLMLEDYARAYNWKAVSLRYFNAAGALPEHDIGECHEPETHAIPILLQAAYAERPFTLFGDDYDTPDGTCVRDYLHIYDLAQAHYLALKYLENEQVSYEAFNLGTGTGSSLKELVDCASRVTGRNIQVKIGPRRAGDPAWLVADPAKARKLLGWVPEQSSLENIIATAHEFHSKKLQK